MKFGRVKTTTWRSSSAPAEKNGASAGKMAGVLAIPPPAL